MTLDHTIRAAIQALLISGKAIDSLRIVEGMSYTDGLLYITLNAKDTSYHAEIKEKITAALAHLPEITAIHFVLTDEKKPKSPINARKRIPHVHTIIAIASGKGGVGKSTTALNLAISFQKSGYTVGILDADIYGPSLPHLVGLHAKPEVNANKKMIPLSKYNLKLFSIGFLIPEDSPVIWRGLMVQSAIKQFVEDIAWGHDGCEIDILIIDLPPGTGDVPLTLIQMIPIDGVVIVSTPQDLALIDARKAYHMFIKSQVPVIGIIENMSFFICSHCHTQTAIFETSGAEKESHTLGVPFLGALPLDPVIRNHADSGIPIGLELDHPISKCYTEISSMIHQILTKNQKITGDTQ